MSSTAEASEDYAARLARVLGYMVDNLDAELDLDRLAGVACFSRFHFHRVYRALQGETAAETLRRLRLHRAAVELIRDRTPIRRISRRAGYTSQAAFTRAFRAHYGLPPGSYRDESRLPRARPPVRIRTVPGVRVAALRHAGEYDSIGDSFERLRALALAQGLAAPGSRYFGIYPDDPTSRPAWQLTSEACVSLPAGRTAGGELRTLEIPGGRYAVLSHVGPYAELERAYGQLYRDWLAESCEEPADRPCVEEYLNDARTTPALELRTDILLPLAEASRDGPAPGGAPGPQR